MKRFFHRFYSIFNLTYIITVTVLFYSNTSLVGNGEAIKIFNFFVSFLIFVALSTMLMLFEHKIYYEKFALIILYGLIGLLFLMFAIINVNHTIRIITTMVIAFVLLAKMIIYSRKHTRFEVNHLNFIPKIYFTTFMSVVVLNVFLSQYIASIFMIMSILLLEIESYIVLRSNEENSDIKLLGTLALILITFFMSYYSKIDLGMNADLNILTNLIMPLTAITLVFVTTSLIGKKINLIVEFETIE